MGNGFPWLLFGAIIRESVTAHRTDVVRVRDRWQENGRRLHAHRDGVSHARHVVDAVGDRDGDVTVGSTWVRLRVHVDYRFQRRLVDRGSCPSTDDEPSRARIVWHAAQTDARQI